MVEGGANLRVTPRCFSCSRLFFAPPPLSDRLEQAIALPASQISDSYVPPRVLTQFLKECVKQKLIPYLRRPKPKKLHPIQR